MANLRDIINAATQGPWVAIGGTDGTADVFVGGAGIAITEDVNDEGYGACSPDNADHIAAYSPDHALLIEEFVSAARPLNQANVNGYNYDVTRLNDALAALDAWREEQGYA